jgi:hypothetical protein
VGYSNLLMDAKLDPKLVTAFIEEGLVGAFCPAASGDEKLKVGPRKQLSFPSL